MEEQEQRQQFELSFKQVMGGNVLPAGCWSLSNRSGVE